MSNEHAEKQRSNILAGGGEMGARMRAFDWSHTALGPLEDWSQSLRTAVRLMLNSRFSMFIWWGKQLTYLYNDAYAPTLGIRHPQALGMPATEVWAEIWHSIGPQATAVIERGEASWDDELLLFLERSGFKEETYHTFSYSPILEDGGAVGGLFCAVMEVTAQVISRRRLTTLRDLSERTAQAQTVGEVFHTACMVLTDNPHDFTFVLLYLLDESGLTARLVESNGIQPNENTAPQSVALGSTTDRWEFSCVLDVARGRVLPQLEATFGRLPAGAWVDDWTRQAFVLPLANTTGQEFPAGFLVTGISPRLSFDNDYRGFLELAAGQIATAIGNARALEEERKRAQALAALDRAKTEFFSNVSHEFRTPLTLMLAPLEDVLNEPDGSLPVAVRAQLETVNRNAMRLLKLVNNLLDFSRIEAGRPQARIEATEIATFTADLASTFRSAVEKAGIKFTVDCPPLGHNVFVDRDMWEKIVLNLLSNAFKFTFAGEIMVSLRQHENNLVLQVRDSGVGIPADQIEDVFKRFHRVRSTQGRTHEGTGIGLSLVQELVKLLGGTIAVESELGTGSLFTVMVPFNRAHEVAEPVGGDRAPTASRAEVFLHEIPDTADALVPLPDSQQPGDSAAPGILVADDNADMREYIQRLLAGAGYAVTTVADGQAALESLRAATLPNLILSDVMMPRLDGFALLKAVRADERLKAIPFVLLSARAGEESKIEGFDAGADDYLVKPFGARELLAQVRANLELARMRREMTQALRESETRLRLAVNAAHMVAWEWDTTRNQITTSGSFEQIYGMPAIRMAEEGFALVHRADLVPHQTAVQNAVASGGNYHSEFRITRPDNGQTVWLEEWGVAETNSQGEVHKLVGITIDITERKQAEADAHFLADLGEIIRTSQDSSSLMATASELIGRHVHASRCCFAETDETRDRWWVQSDYRSDSLASMVGEYRLSDYPPVILDALRAGRVYASADNKYDARSAAYHAEAFAPLDLRAYVVVPFHVEGRWAMNLVTASSEPRQWHAREIGLLETAAERVWHAVEKLRADGALRVSEERLQALLSREQSARQQAEEASRLKDEFLATVSHELRTPLTSILGYGQLIQARQRDAGYITRTIDKIVRSARTQAQLIEDLLDVSRIVSGKLRLEPRAIDLVPVVHAAVDAVRPAMDAKGLQVQIALDGQHCVIVGDPNRLQQVVWNLLSNAVKFTPPAGAIELRLQQVAGAVELTVSDSGQGISAEFLPHVFERFRQAEGASTRSNGGLGLGLSIVRHLVEMHGGTVQARSDGPGRGATFVVTLPRTRPAKHENPGHSGEQHAANGCPPELRGLRVLVVEDQSEIIELLEETLSECGAVVRSHNNARAGLAELRSWQPDVLISDIAMPYQDGYWLIEQVRALAPEEGGTTPAIALTAYIRVEDRTQVLTAGFHLYIPKPIEPDELRAAVASLTAVER